MSNINKLLSEPIKLSNMGRIFEQLSEHSKGKLTIFCAKKVIHLTEAVCIGYTAHAARHAAYNIVFRKPDTFSSNDAYYVVWALSYILEGTQDRNQEQLKAEIIAYLKELVIEELPQELRENWLLVASL